MGSPAGYEESEWSAATGRQIRDEVRKLIPLMREYALKSEKQGVPDGGGKTASGKEIGESR